MARICLEYESEVQDSQRRPANLLDALEQGNHGTGEDSDFTMGEKKVACFINSHRVCGVGGLHYKTKKFKYQIFHLFCF